MRIIVSVILFAASACATDSIDDMQTTMPGDPPESMQPAKLEVTLDHQTFVDVGPVATPLGTGDAEVVQILLAGTFAGGAEGDEVAIAVGSRAFAGDALSIGQSWDGDGVSSDDLTAGGCGSWAAVNTQYTLRCRDVDGSHAEWHYQEGRKFQVDAMGQWTAEFQIEAIDVKRLVVVDCRVARKSSDGLFELGPC
ncbi:MAG TPA: hypothetical protein VL326_09640 [Kofleriaceae bacterium]|nr:hypothetical protein [Kofleriaceae bacterium]